jgi:tRNA-specific adenosine deaminase 3
MRKPKFKIPTKVEVRYSPGKGRGVFATKPIRRGEAIEVAPSLMVPASDEARLAGSFLRHYLFQTDDGRHYVVAMGYVAIANHSDDANATFDITTEASTIRATKSIRVGQEVCVDYGWTEAEWHAMGRAKL